VRPEGAGGSEPLLLHLMMRRPEIMKYKKQQKEHPMSDQILAHEEQKGVAESSTAVVGKGEGGTAHMPDARQGMA
jgi:hypothetical protein